MPDGADECAAQGHSTTHEESRGAWTAVVCDRCGATLDAHSN